MPIPMSTLSAIVKDHTKGHTVHYVRRVDVSSHEVLLVPTSEGNLSNTASIANKLSNYLLVELKHATITIDYSGTAPPPTALAQTGTAIGWILLILILTGTGLYVYTKSTGKA